MCWDGAAPCSCTDWETAGLGAALQKRTWDPGGHQVNPSLQCTLPNFILSCSKTKAGRSREKSFPLLPHWYSHRWKTVASFGLPNTMQTLADQIKSHRGPPRLLGAKAHDVGEAERDSLVQPGEETAQGRPYCCLQLFNGRTQRR